MNDSLAYHLYVDGGCITCNPSPVGGTFAWLLVSSKGRKLEYDSGVIPPGYGGLKKITNNLAELYAALAGLEHVLKEWDGYRGYLWTDSRVTYHRMMYSHSFAGIPDELRKHCLRLRQSGLWVPMLLKGHPTAADLKRGYTKKGVPVSRYNVFVDEKCQEEADKYLYQHREKMIAQRTVTSQQWKTIRRISRLEDQQCQEQN